MENLLTKNISYDVANKTKKNIVKENVVKGKNKKRVESENWKFDIEYFCHLKQLDMVKDMLLKNDSENKEVSKIIIQQINRKIYGYKQQDIFKKLFNANEFITFDSIIKTMVDCELKCYYCSTEMNVLYDISREMKQWTVDRINNDLGHNLNNYYLACLECNLKRRRRSDEKFLFTKQLKLIKLNEDSSSLV